MHAGRVTAVTGRTGEQATILVPVDVVYMRGDADGDGSFNALIDALYILAFQFIAASPEPPCLDAADANDDGMLNGLLDALVILNMWFTPGTAPLPPPWPDCGFADPDLGCQAPPVCF